MNSLTLSRCALSVCAAATLLAGCGGLQPAGVTQGPVPQGQVPENPSLVTGVRQSPRSVRHASVTETVLYSFGAHPYDGENPAAGLTYFNGALYGTTDGGGLSKCSACGTVFSVTPSGTETVLYSFTSGQDGASPDARMIVRNGTLYGTTYGGGGKCVCGTVFSITPSGRETVLHGFAGSPDGSQPLARLLNVNGTLYGTTEYGGDGSCYPYAGCGTVFSITPGGKEKVLYNFGSGGGYDARNPAAGLVDVSGTLYGTTNAGGAYGSGTVFSITLRGKEKVLHSFSCCRGDGYYLLATLLNVNGTLYGTTLYGGAYKYGTVFSITRSGYETVLYSFRGHGDGREPGSGVIDVNGTLYGTTVRGGAHRCGAYGCGTVYSITL